MTARRVAVPPTVLNVAPEPVLIKKGDDELGGAPSGMEPAP